MFRDRVDAGERLAEGLTGFAEQRGVLVLGIPRGGVVVAQAVARMLSLPFSALIVRKLGAPGNPELAIGAVAGDGKPVWNEALLGHLAVPESWKKEELERQLKEVRDRMRRFGLTQDLPLQGKTVVLVDDGVATGATVKAALQVLEMRGCKRRVLAVPVCAPDTAEELRRLADEFVCLEQPQLFTAVGQAYEDFREVSDEDVKKLLLQE